MSGMWADFIRLDLAIENTTGKQIEFNNRNSKLIIFVFSNV